jgi:hypothetical protein
VSSISTTLSPRTLYTLRHPSPHFQRAINLKYDLGDADYIAAYVPTPNAARAIHILLQSAQPDAKQRATLLYGPYGSGKSLLATVLAAMLSCNEALREALVPVVQRLYGVDHEAAALAEEYLHAGPRLLPVVLSGDEGDLSSALLRGLTQALLWVGLGDIRPRTHYQAALETIAMWQVKYPETYDRLAALLQTEGHSLESLSEGLRFAEPQAYDLFQRLYPRLTAGAMFNNHHGQSVVDAYRETVVTLRASTDYDGVVVLWDEFGRFLEGRAGEPFGREAATLQEFAEFACRSGEAQVHLTLITHKVMGGYAWGLPDEYLQEWQRIGDRFRQLDVSGDPLVAYRLIAAALTVTDPAAWADYLAGHQTDLAWMMSRMVGQHLFLELDEAEVRRWILEGAFPLHPLTVYCLPRLSNKVAQNERTLFTFLAADEPDTLVERLSYISLDGSLQWVGLDVLYDYFAEAMRADTGSGGVHGVWAAAEHALGKTPPEDPVTHRLVKTLAVLQAVGETDVLHPTVPTLAFALEADTEAVERASQYLVRRKLARLHKLDRTWELATGSDVDIEAAVTEVLDRRPPTSLQLRRRLEEVLPPRPYQARRHNHKHGMVRFFWGWYRNPEEIEANTNWDIVLKESGYADGLVVYVLARNAGELDKARAIVEATTAERVLFVLPRMPLLIEEPLHELFALTELKNDPVFREQDERVIAELEFFIEDATARLERALAPLVDPRENGSDWYWRGEPWSRFPIDSSGRVTRLISDICDGIFAQTPVLRNEAFNRRTPSKVQVRAAQKVIEALLTNEPDERLGLTGYGPDWLIVNTILRAPGILRQTDDWGWIIGEPTDERMTRVWDVMEQFFKRAREGPRSFTDLLDTLQSPPFGLRLGVLPVLIAAALRRHLHVAMVRRDRKPVLPLIGTTFTGLCWRSEHYTLELGPEDARQAAVWTLLEERFGGQVLPEERRHQPLRYLSLGMVRWLQGLPRFAQMTRRLSQDALRLRQLIRAAVKEPGHVLFDELPALLENSEITLDTGGAYRELTAARLSALMGELETTYLDLLRRLDHFAVNLFAAEAPTAKHDGRSALAYWIAGVEARCGHALSELRFCDVRTEGLVRVADSDAREGAFWDELAHRIFGLAPRDWDDRSEERFYEVLANTKAEVEREALGLAVEADNVIEVNLHTGRDDPRAYRFRQVPLSEQGQRLLQNFKSTLEIAGRPLSSDERRQVVLALLHHVLGEEDA